MFLDKLHGKKLLLIPLVLAALIFVVLVIKYLKPESSFLSGEIDCRQTDVSSKLAGRIDSLYVQEGQYIEKGGTLARMLSPEIQAKYDQAVDAAASAKAIYDMAVNGARQQDISSARELYTAAKAKYEITLKTYNRLQELLNRKSITRQNFDEAQARLEGARAEMNAAQAQFEKAVQGARSEEISAARGNYERALNALKEVRSYLDETYLTAPVSGEIDNLIVDPGEIVAAGYPVVTMIDLSNVWVSVYVPETALKSFSKGSVHNVDIPALGLKNISCQVQYISALADFATRKATNDSGSFDLKSFELHLVPTRPIPNLRPGMSALVHLK